MLECNDSMKLPIYNLWPVSALFFLALIACGDPEDPNSVPGNNSTTPPTSQDMSSGEQEDMGQVNNSTSSNNASSDMGMPIAGGDMSAEADLDVAEFDSGDPYPEDAWTVRIEKMTALHRPGPDGCLRATSDPITIGETFEVLAANTHWLLVHDGGEARGLLLRADILELSRPYEPEDLPRGVLGRVTDLVALHTWGEQGCPTKLGVDLEALTEIEILAKFHDDAYRGWAVTDHTLTLAPVRKIEASGMPFPWEAAVQLVQMIPTGGFITGGGVLIGPRHILTSASLKADETFCYSRAPRTELSVDTLSLSCGRIISVTDHPRGVDLAILELELPEPGPHAKLADTSPSPGDTFYTTDFSTLKRDALRDGTVARVGSENANCEEWPALSTFSAKEMLISPGDAGGPAFQGDTLVGIVHGLRCQQTEGEPPHLFINIAGVRAFIDEVLQQPVP